MTMKIMVSKEEEELILANRVKEDLVSISLFRTKHILEQARDFYVWLSDNNRERSFSAYINEFDGDCSGLEPSMMYELVSRVLIGVGCSVLAYDEFVTCVTFRYDKFLRDTGRPNTFSTFSQSFESGVDAEEVYDLVYAKMTELNMV